mmetsp:Transcript_27469/g.44677  ORF Transcript_27469/g.44677 Transcript_27469/m.44677 type:complete len:290 (+) Transcript_27469:1764-2633(+)
MGRIATARETWLNGVHKTIDSSLSKRVENGNLSILKRCFVSQGRNVYVADAIYAYDDQARSHLYDSKTIKLGRMFGTTPLFVPASPILALSLRSSPSLHSRRRCPLDNKNRNLRTQIVCTAAPEKSTFSSSATRRQWLASTVGALAAFTSVVPSKAAEKLKTLPSGLSYVDLQVGKGASPLKGDLVVISYTGRLEDGTQFDSTSDPGRKPLAFNFEAGQVIKGLDEGLATMQVGGKRKLIIPAELAYGAKGAGCDENGSGCVIPPGSTLTFEVELLKASIPPNTSAEGF